LSQPWIVKYRPRKFEAVIGNKKAKEAFMIWLKNWSTGKESENAALLYGPPGTGKTVTVEAAANTFNFDLVEVNASDARSGEVLKKVAGLAAVQSDLFGRRRILLLDEIDGINMSVDRGAVPVLLDVIKKTRNPIVCTANDPWNPKIRSLREKCLLIEFKRLGIRDTLLFLRTICEKEKVKADDTVLKQLIQQNKGDIRGVLNDLQTVSSIKKTLSLEDLQLLPSRNRVAEIFSVVRHIFYAKDYLDARRSIDQANIDYTMLFEWIYGNASSQLNNIHDLATALSILARAQLYLTYIEKKRQWRLIPYALDLMTAGVATARKESKPTFTFVRFPERIRYMSQIRRQRATRTALTKKIGIYTHLSSKRSQSQILPYIRFIIQHNPRMAEELSHDLQLTEDEKQLIQRN
jgi:replication factor C large subunit